MIYKITILSLKTDTRFLLSTVFSIFQYAQLQIPPHSPTQEK